MNESDLEHELRGLRPARPSASLEGRVAVALPADRSARRPWNRWLTERLLWAAGGAVAAWLIAPWFSAPLAPTGAAPASPPPAALPRVTEEPFAWSDEGVQLVDGDTPARMLRRLVVERHQSPDGSAEVRVPREDVILLPVAIR